MRAVVSRKSGKKFLHPTWTSLQISNDLDLPWFILKSLEMGQYFNSLRKVYIRITEKLIRRDFLWSLVQVPT